MNNAITINIIVTYDEINKCDETSMRSHKLSPHMNVAYFFFRSKCINEMVKF